MRIAIVSIDTRGGVQPYVALAVGLRRAGHDVRLVVPGNFVPMAQERGLVAAPLSGSVEDAVRGLAGQSPRTRLGRVRVERAVIGDRLRDWLRETVAACEGSDLLLGGGGALVGRPVARALGVPFLTAHLQPLEAPTSAHPGVLLPQVPSWLGGPGRRLSHWLTDAALQLPHRAALRRARSEALGPPRRDGAGRQVARRQASLPVLYGVSRHVVPPPADWSPNRHVTGYWQLPAGSQWSPPPALVDFLAAGPPPVCIGFGSMPSPDPQALAALVLAAVRRAGVRAVLLSGWGALDPGQLGDPDRRDVLALAEAPHDWLYPQVAAAVHHGGAGTTGASLSAGLPTVVVPWGADQPFWGHRVAALQVGPQPIPRRRLRVDSLAAALRRVTTDEAMRRRATALGAAIRSEDGVAEAVRHVDAVADAVTGRAPGERRQRSRPGR